MSSNELARHPITLVAMAIVFHVDGELPEFRAKLYERCAEALAGRWDLRMHDDAGRALAGAVSVDDKLNVLEGLAAAIYMRGSDQEPRLERYETAQIVQDTLPEKHRPRSERAAWDFVQRLADRSGLLTPEGERGWRFRHKTFLEYLTARQICRNAPDAGAALGEHLTDSWWREVILLAVGYEATRGSALAGRMLKTLWLSANALDAQVDALGVVAHASLDARAFGMQDLDDAFGPDWRTTLAGLLDDVKMPGRLESRVAIARLLGAVGDPRVGYEDDVHLMSVPEGPFIMGGTDESAFGDEKPIGEVYVSAFRIARHPVTFAQFGTFIDDGGYHDARWWPHGGADRDNVDGFRDGIRRTPNAPVVGTSWFESMAYCEWLNHTRPREDGWLYRLPTEAEWEKAARGGLSLGNETNPMPRRAYPWGDDFRPDAAQHDESRPSALVPVGCHAAGAGPYGTHDQAGNVWEWTLDAWTNDYEWHTNADRGAVKDPRRYDSEATLNEDDRRVVRGGSFVFDPGWLRVSCRGWELGVVAQTTTWAFVSWRRRSRGPSNLDPCPSRPPQAGAIATDLDRQRPPLFGSIAARRPSHRQPILLFSAWMSEFVQHRRNVCRPAMPMTPVKHAANGRSCRSPQSRLASLSLDGAKHQRGRSAPRAQPPHGPPPRAIWPATRPKRRSRMAHRPRRALFGHRGGRRPAPRADADPRSPRCGKQLPM